MYKFLAYFSEDVECIYLFSRLTKRASRWGVLGRGTGTRLGWEVLALGRCSQPGFVLVNSGQEKKKKSFSLMPGAARGGEGLRGEGYELLLRYYQALLGRCFSCM